MTRSRATADTQDNNGGSVAPFVAGKNRILNSDFSIWQRGTTFNSAANGIYSADRFTISFNGTGATRNLSQQTFTPGSAPVAGYEGQFFHRYAQTVAGTGGTFSNFGTRIEDVRVLAGQTATFSFWARVSSGTINVDPYVEQFFGSGGSSSNYNLMGSTITITTSWQRFTCTATLPSISGKTIGTGSHLFAYFSLPNNSTFTLDTWGWQLEAGSVATPFTTATGTIQGELAACQRYYWRSNNATAVAYASFGTGFAQGTTVGDIFVQYPVPMRVAPTSADFANLNCVDSAYAGGAVSAIAIVTDSTTERMAKIGVTTTGLTAFRPALLRGNNNTGSYFGLSAEL